MKAYRKASLLIYAVPVILMGALYLSSQLILLKGFLDLENHYTLRNISRVLDALNETIRALDSRVEDWAPWDDTYNFAAGKNPGFVTDYLYDTALSRLKINLILFVDTSGRLVYGKAFDLEREVEVTLSEGLKEQIDTHPELWHFPDLDGYARGVLMLPEGPMIIAARPLLTNDGKGPTTGTLLMGRYLDDVELARLAEVTRVAIVAQPFGNAHAPEDFRQARSGFLSDESPQVRSLDDVTIAGYALFKDVFGDPGLILRISVARDVYRHGGQTVTYFLVTLLVVCIIAVFAVHLLLQRLTRSEEGRRETEACHRAIVEQSGEGICLVDAQSKKLLEANSAFCNLLGYEPKDVLGLIFYDIVNNDRGLADRCLQEVMTEGRHTSGETEYQRKDASRIHLEFGINLVTYDGDKGVLSVIVRDITARKEAQERIRYLAHFDPLTHLPNRILLHDRLQQSVSHAQRTGSMVAVMFLDLDRFKVVNDSLGHQMGDLLLGGVAQRLRQSIRQNDTVSRQSGDEFVIIMSDLTKVEDCYSVAEKILQSLHHPFDIEGQELHIGTSIGICLYPKDGGDIGTLMKNADIAMYQAKEAGGNTYQFFSSHMTARGLRRLALENGLRQALRRNEFSLVYQPQGELGTDRIFGVEALLRWRHPELGQVAPADFIPVAEETGLIVPIGEWVFRTACKEMWECQRQGCPPLRVAVNLSARQFVQKDLAQMVSCILEETGFPAPWLEIELTESTLMRTTSDSVTKLGALKAMGISISIDDFGTGYSSLAYLQRLPIDTVKIDGSLVRRVCSERGDAAITKAVVVLAHSLGLKVVAEWVETKEQLEFLQRHGCDAIQGYHLSPPLSVEALARLLQGKRRVVL